jgi:hypothetical protein
MKKLIASFTVVVYLAFACGVLVNFHYCMDRYDSYSFYKAKSDWCPKCHMHTGTRGCCHDEVKIIKLQDDHQTSSLSFDVKDVQLSTIALSEFLSIVTLRENLRSRQNRSLSSVAVRAGYLYPKPRFQDLRFLSQ